MSPADERRLKVRQPLFLENVVRPRSNSGDEGSEGVIHQALESLPKKYIIENKSRESGIVTQYTTLSSILHLRHSQHRRMVVHLYLRFHRLQYFVCLFVDLSSVLP